MNFAALDIQHLDGFLRQLSGCWFPDLTSPVQLFFALVKKTYISSWTGASMLTLSVPGDGIRQVVSSLRQDMFLRCRLTVNKYNIIIYNNVIMTWDDQQSYQRLKLGLNQRDLGTCVKYGLPTGRVTETYSALTQNGFCS